MGNKGNRKNIESKDNRKNIENIENRDSKENKDNREKIESAKNSTSNIFNKARIIAAVCAAKAAFRLIHRFGKGGGSTFPGRAARAVCPDILTAFARQIHERGGKIIVTTGTNGKTTVNSMICHALEYEGKHVIINKTGANMQSGIAAAFALAADRRGRLHADYACIEVDELTAPAAFPALDPDIIILTNISRDQLDRFGEVDTTCAKIKDAVSSVPDAVLVVNCDDVLSYGLSLDCENRTVTYGIDERIFDDNSRSEIRESIFCKVCGEKLVYDFFHYGQLGIYKCPHCGFERPMPDHTAAGISHNGENYSFDINSFCSKPLYENKSDCARSATEIGFADNICHINASMRFPYNIYNVICVYAALRSANIPCENFADSIGNFDFLNDRESIFTINDATVQLHLSKNPVGFQQKISFILQDPRPKDIIIQINDTYQDGKDISWLWDVDFEALADPHTASIFASGTRRFDMGLRLKYSDIECRFTNDMRETVKELTAYATKNLYIIVNYSGLYETNRMLSELLSQSGMHRHSHASGNNESNKNSLNNCAGTSSRRQGNESKARGSRTKRIKRFFREIFTKEA